MKLQTTEAAPAAPRAAIAAPVESQEAPHAARRRRSRRERPRPEKRRTRNGRLDRGEALLLWFGFGIPGLALLVGAAFSWVGRPPTEAPAPPVTLPPSNAYRDFVNAGKLAVDQRSAYPLRGAQKRPPLTAAQRGHLVRANAPALTMLRGALGKPFAWPAVYSFDAVFPEYADFRRLAQALALESQERQANGDAAGAAASLIDAIEMGATIPKGGLMIARMVGQSCETIGQEALAPRVDALDAATAAAAARRLEAIDARRSPYLETVRTEGAWTHESLRRSLSKASTSEFLRSLQPSEGQSLGTALRVVLVSRQTILDNHRLRVEAAAAHASLPWSSPLRRLPYSGPTDLVNDILAPAFESAELRDRLARTKTALLTAHLALHAYHQTHGAWPKTLDQLVTARILQFVPQDAFTEGASLRYQWHDRKPVLYSIGPDGRDDRGVAIASSREPIGEQSRGDIVSAITPM